MSSRTKQEPSDDSDHLYNLVEDLSFLQYEYSIEQIKPSSFDFICGTEYTEPCNFSVTGLHLIENFLHIGMVNESTAAKPLNKNRILMNVYPQFVSPLAYQNRKSYLPGIKKIKTIVFCVPEEVFLKYSTGNGSRHEVITATAVVAPFEMWKLQERMVISSFYRFIFDKPGTDMFGDENVWKNFSLDTLDKGWKQLLFICCGPQSIAYVIKRLIKRNWARLARMAVSEENGLDKEDLVFCQRELLSLLTKWSKFSFTNEKFFSFLNRVNTMKPLLGPSNIFELAKAEFENTVALSKKYRCQHCAYATNHSDNYVKHLRTHTGEKPFTCTVCNKSFRLKKHMKEHSFLHTGIYPLSCNLCGKPFTNITLMKLHIMNKHKLNNKIQCYRCNLLFRSEIDLKNHLPSHANDVVHQCSTCYRRYDSQSKLQDHMRNHSDNKPFKCHICGRGFLLENHFNTHFKVHSATALFDCEFCGKSFKTNSNHRRHQLLVHSSYFQE